MPLTGLTGTDSTNEFMMTRIGGEEGIFVNATSTSSAATANGAFGIITTESLNTAATASYTMVLTNNFITAADMVQVSVANGSNSVGAPSVGSITPGTGTCSIVITNTSVTTALSGTLKIAWQVIKAATVPIPVLSS